MFRIMSMSSMNFLSNLQREQFSSFRKRVVGQILGTDMARHAIELASLKDKLANIKNDGKSLSEGLFGEGVNDIQTYKNQQ